MRTFLIQILLFAVGIISTKVACQQVRELNRIDFPKEEISKEEIIVKYKEGYSPEGLSTNSSRVLGSANNSTKSVLNGMYKIKLSTGQDAVDICNEYLKNPNVLYAEPVRTFELLHRPNDKNISAQYHHNLIQTFKAWDISRGDDDIAIGIIDTGIDLKHLDITENLWTNEKDPIDGKDNDNNGYVDDYYGYDFADKDSDPTVGKNIHGMRVAGIAGAVADNKIGIAGIGYNTKVAALKGFTSADTRGGGLYDAIRYAADNGIQIVNLSWGSPKKPVKHEQDIINYAVLEKNVVVIAAAGNNGTEEAFYPANYDHVLAVSATDANDVRWFKSTYNYGVDLVAPGQLVFSTVGDNGYGKDSGTSYAAPMVSAAAALIWTKFPKLNALQVMERLRVTTDDIYQIAKNGAYKDKLGSGRLNIYKALTQKNPKSARLEGIQISNNNQELFFAGDTVTITAKLKNYLSPTTDLKLSVQHSEQFKAIDSVIQLYSMSPLSEKNISFQVILDKNLTPNTSVPVKIQYNDENYEDFQVIEVRTAPDYLNFGNNNTSLTLASNGNLAYEDVKYANGTGFTKNKIKILDHAGIIIAKSSKKVSDNIIKNYSSTERNQDFKTKSTIRYFSHPVADKYAYTSYEDTINKVLVQQSSYSWEKEPFILLKYRLINSSKDTLKNLSAGIFSDWDLIDKKKNKALYDSTGFSYVVDDNNGLFAAVKIISDAPVKTSALDIGSENGNNSDLKDQNFTDSIKYNHLATKQKAKSGTQGKGNNVATIQGITLPKITPYNSTVFYAVWTADATLSNLKKHFATANEKIKQLESNPKTLENIYTCKGANVEINPASGKLFQFYKDALGKNLIAKGEKIIINNILKDTSIFVQNIDKKYSDEIQKINVSFISKFAKFDLPTDTVYLVNSRYDIKFADKSIGAIKWNWDFGNKSATQLQNPSISYFKEGTYTIKLKVENKFGCKDSISRKLFIAKRPSSPNITDTYTICPNKSITLTDSKANKLNLYTNNTSPTPILSGKTITTPAISSSQAYYVSGIYNKLESERKKISITVKDFSPKINFKPDTTSATNKVIFEAIVQKDSKVKWEIDGKQSSEKTFSISLEKPKTISAKLIVTNANGCSKTIEEKFLMNSSPIARQETLTRCNNSIVKIAPTNGKYFGFYQDEKLTKFIKKGKSLATNSHEKVFVVGLDDGLPGKPTEVKIEKESFQVSIEYDSNTVADKVKTTLKFQKSKHTKGVNWFLNGNQVGISDTLILFLDKIKNIIVLKTTNLKGCEAVDTLNIDFSKKILNIKTLYSSIIYPNPSKGIFHLQNHKQIAELTLFDAKGMQVFYAKKPSKTILTSLPNGIYIASILLKNREIITSKIIIKR